MKRPTGVSGAVLDYRREAESDTVGPTIIVSNYCILVLYNTPNVSQSRALEDVVCTAKSTIRVESVYRPQNGTTRDSNHYPLTPSASNK